jgi:hypothetical protein
MDFDTLNGRMMMLRRRWRMAAKVDMCIKITCEPVKGSLKGGLNNVINQGMHEPWALGCAG